MAEMLNKRERRIIQKEWGWIDWIHNEGFCGKVIFMKRGKHCSWHYHDTTEEVIYVEDGKVKVAYQEDSNDIEYKELKTGDACKLKVGVKHQFQAISDVYLFEFSLHQPESDIKRIHHDRV